MGQVRITRSLAMASALGLIVLAALGWVLGVPTRAQAPQKGGAGAPVAVVIGTVERRRIPIEIEAIGTVTPIASVALKARVDSTIESVHFEDGAHVRAGDVLFTLDSRQIDAEIKQAEGTLAKDRAQFAGAQRDVARYRALIGKGATTQVSLDNALTQVDTLQGTLRADEAALDALKVQKSYLTISAPISGRISAASLKAGNFVKSGDANALATINQIAPVYVAFSVPQQDLPPLRAALKAGTTRVAVRVPGADIEENGTVALIDNAVDSATGMVTARAIMANVQETLWPGTLVRVRLIMREEEALTVPALAIQRGQDGDFVFVVEDGRAAARPVAVLRRHGDVAAIGAGLEPGAQVVTDGQLGLRDGTAIAPRADSTIGPAAPTKSGS